LKIRFRIKDFFGNRVPEISSLPKILFRIMDTKKLDSLVELKSWDNLIMEG
jgi:hypothetical protein